MTETARSGSARSGRAKGLTFERIHTTPGVHPYDEVTWELRDINQTNWKSGEVIFDQKGWSSRLLVGQRSTIVTTKYFRGAVGTRLAERSLKQLIDRVVLTYTKAGWEHGYFTPQDAEIFEHELTHALLHQVFSFNSPVVSTSARGALSRSRRAIPLLSTIRWTRSWLVQEEARSSRGLGRRPQPLPDPVLRSCCPAAARRAAGVLHAGADASAGTIKSAVRRDVPPRWSSPTWTTPRHRGVRRHQGARGEDKIRALRDAGFDMDLGGRDITSACNTRTPTTRSASTTSSCARSKRAASSACGLHDRRGHRHRRRGAP